MLLHCICNTLHSRLTHLERYMNSDSNLHVHTHTPTHTHTHTHTHCHSHVRCWLLLNCTEGCKHTHAHILLYSFRLIQWAENISMHNEPWSHLNNRWEKMDLGIHCNFSSEQNNHLPKTRHHWKMYISEREHRGRESVYVRVGESQHSLVLIKSIFTFTWAAWCCPSRFLPTVSLCS